MLDTVSNILEQQVQEEKALLQETSLCPLTPRLDP